MVLNILSFSWTAIIPDIVCKCYVLTCHNFVLVGIGVGIDRLGRFVAVVTPTFKGTVATWFGWVRIWILAVWVIGVVTGGIMIWNAYACLLRRTSVCYIIRTRIPRHILTYQTTNIRLHNRMII